MPCVEMRGELQKGREAELRGPVEVKDGRAGILRLKKLIPETGNV